MVMDRHGAGVALMGDVVQPYELKHMLPECFVSVKLETYEESSCSDLQQYPVALKASSSAAPSSNQPTLPNRRSCCPGSNSQTCDCTPLKQQSPVTTSCTTQSSPQILYQVHMTTPIMQQTQPSNQSQNSQSQQATSQAAQISHAAEATHVSQAGSRPPPQGTVPPPVPTPHSFPHPHSRPSEIAWMSHPYVDQNAQHFHAHQMSYLPNDATLLSSLPQAQEGTRIVKQSAEGCRSENNSSGTVPAGEAGDNNAFISYVLNPQRGVSTAGIFLFDASRGLPPHAAHQIPANNGSSSRSNANHTVSGRSVEEVIRDNSSDTTSTSESPKPEENHLVSRSCQTVVTMSQIQDAPLLSDAKIIISDNATPLVEPEPEDNKDRVFIEADGEDSEEASSMESECESENLKRVTRLGSGCTGFGEQVNFGHQHSTQNCHGQLNCVTAAVNSCNRNVKCLGGQCSECGGVTKASVVQGSTTQHKNESSSHRKNNSNENLGSPNFPFLENDKPFRCDVCGKSYSSQQALVNHDRYHRGERPYECETCHKAFATNSHLVTHRRTHTGERPFQCQLCQRCFADRSAFVKHERTHGPNGSIVKRYKCDECGSGFVDSCGLKKHVRIHTGERPYVCNVCQKSFSASSSFVAHKRIHTGERPYKCESCDKMFITKSHLLTHRRTHTGEKPFTCNVCNRCFADGSSYRRHERLHTGENRHICIHCGRGFPLESSLEKHKQTHVQTSSFSYMYENRSDLNCLPSQQQSCDLQSSRSARISIPQVRDTSDRNICVDLSREIAGDVSVNRNSLCAVASREIDCESQSAHASIMVAAREIA